MSRHTLVYVAVAGSSLRIHADLSEHSAEHRIAGNSTDRKALWPDAFVPDDM
jgi:hypothetical protein